MRVKFPGTEIKTHFTFNYFKIQIGTMKINMYLYSSNKIIIGICWHLPTLLLIFSILHNLTPVWQISCIRMVFKLCRWLMTWPWKRGRCIRDIWHWEAWTACLLQFRKRTVLGWHIIVQTWKDRMLHPQSKNNCSVMETWCGTEK